MESIANETLNLLNVSEAKIQVRKNLYGFMPATIEIQDERRGNIFLNFGDIETTKAPKEIHGALFLKDFSNPIDLMRLKLVAQDEGIDINFPIQDLDFLLQNKSSFSRNPSIKDYSHVRKHPSELSHPLPECRPFPMVVGIPKIPKKDQPTNVNAPHLISSVEIEESKLRRKEKGPNLSVPAAEVNLISDGSPPKITS